MPDECILIAKAAYTHVTKRGCRLGLLYKYVKYKKVIN